MLPDPESLLPKGIAEGYPAYGVDQDRSKAMVRIEGTSRQDDKGNETGGIHFEEWDWLELSAVTIPANAECTITTIKSYDQDPVKRSQVVNALSERHSRINKALERIERAKSALEYRK